MFYGYFFVLDFMVFDYCVFVGPVEIHMKNVCMVWNACTTDRAVASSEHTEWTEIVPFAWMLRARLRPVKMSLRSGKHQSNVLFRYLLHSVAIVVVVFCCCNFVSVLCICLCHGVGRTQLNYEIISFQRRHSLRFFVFTSQLIAGDHWSEV